MTWRGDVKKHYENVDKAFDVLRLIDDDDLQTKNVIREVILNELRLSCESIIDWLDDSNNVNSKNANLYLKTLNSGYDICVIIEARCFIYKLLDKSLYELLNMN